MEAKLSVELQVPLLFVFVFSFNNYAISDVYIDMSFRYDYCCKRLGIFIAGF